MGNQTSVAQDNNTLISMDPEDFKSYVSDDASPREVELKNEVFMDISAIEITPMSSKCRCIMEDLISASMEMGDGLTNIRHAVYLSLRLKDPSEIYDYFNSVLQMPKTSIQLRQFAMAYMLSDYDESAQQDLIASITLDTEIPAAMRAEFTDQHLELAKVDYIQGKWVHDINVSQIMGLYSSKKIGRMEYAAKISRYFMSYYLQKFGTQVSCAYLQLFFDIHLAGDTYDKKLAARSYIMLGIADYRAFTRRGLFHPELAERFNILRKSEALLSKHMEVLERMEKEIQVPKAKGIKTKKTKVTKLIQLSGP